MVFRKDILTLAVALAFAATPGFASSPQSTTKTAAPAASKTKAPAKTNDHVLKGSVVSASNDAVTVRSGKKDTTFKIDASTQKPSSIGPGSEITVTYHDNGKDHVASNIEAAAAKAISAAPKAKK